MKGKKIINLVFIGAVSASILSGCSKRNEWTDNNRDGRDDRTGVVYVQTYPWWMFWNNGSRSGFSSQPLRSSGFSSPSRPSISTPSTGISRGGFGGFGRGFGGSSF